MRMSARRWRSGLALALALGAAAAALLAAVSPPTFPLWEAHLVCLELGLVMATTEINLFTAIVLLAVARIVSAIATGMGIGALLGALLGTSLR